MDSSKKIFFLLILTLIIAGAIVGAFYFLKSEPTPTGQMSVEQKPAIPGFKRDINNTLPTSFPKNLITEKGVTPVESFSVKGATETQDTYRYLTALTADQNYNNFSKFFNTNSWKKVSDVEIGSDWFLTYSKTGQTLSISYSVNTITKDKIVDITLSTKNNE